MSSWPTWAKFVQIWYWVSFGVSATVASRQASAFCSGSGSAARAPAARSAPRAVLSRANSASISSAPTAPARASWVSRCQRRSVSIASPYGLSSPLSQALTTSVSGSVVAAAASARA